MKRQERYWSVDGVDNLVQLLRRGRTDSFYVTLKGVSNLKNIPHVVDFRKEGYLESSFSIVRYHSKHLDFEKVVDLFL